MMKSSSKKQRRRIEGVVTSDKMAKTVVVTVTRMRQHSKYLKYYKVHASFKAHDEQNEYKTGDRVVIEEVRPMSRTKRWKVVSLIQKSEPKSGSEIKLT